jgi:hypothetical protein
MKTNHTYGVAPNGNYCDVSRTLRGAKNYAARHGYSEVYIRFNCGYHVTLKAEKVNGKWVDV